MRASILRGWSGLLLGLLLPFLPSVMAYAQGVPKVYFGNLHSHSSYSDGLGTPQEAYEHARDRGKLDFLALTDHNHAAAEDGAKGDRRDGKLIGKDPTLYKGPQENAIMLAAARCTQPGRFVALYGQEFSSVSKGNHINVFDVPEVIDVPSGRFDLLLPWLRQRLDSTTQVPIIQLNHPGENDKLDPSRRLEYGIDDFGSQTQWVSQMGQYACLIEILNGPAMAEGSDNRPEVFEKDYGRYLSMGFRVAPTGNQDNHKRTWGTCTNARTALLAEELTREKLLAAIRARHVYATEDENLRLIFRVNGQLCGEQIPAPLPGTELKIEYRIEDDDEPYADYRIDVFEGVTGGDLPTCVETVTDEGDTPKDKWRSIEDVRYDGGRRYIYFRVRQTGDHSSDRAWTAPIWLTEFNPANATSASDSCVASRNSNKYHVSLECRIARGIKETNRIWGEEARRGRELHEGCPTK